MWEKIGWEVRNGKRVRIWEDKWVAKEGPLKERCIRTPNVELSKMLIADLVNV